MKSYAITVNGVVYDVTVEEKGASAPAAPAPAAAPVPAAPAAPAPSAAPAAPAGAGSVNVESQIQGKVLRIEAPVSTAVKTGDNIIIIESMKMEIPIVAPQDGTIASINVKEGDMIDSGTLIATMD